MKELGKVYFGTNTKMYKNIAQTVDFLTRLDTLTTDLSRETLELFVIPSFTALESARRCVPPERIALGPRTWAGRMRDSSQARSPR